MRLILFLLLSTLPLVSEMQAQIVNIEESRITGTNDSTNWYGSLKAGASLAKVSRQSLVLTGAIRVQYKRNPHLLLLLSNLNFLRAGNQNFTNQAFLHIRYNYKLAETWTWEGFTQTQRNPLQLLEQRSLVGTGPRWRALKSADGKQRLYLGVATLWEHNNFSMEFPDQYWNRLSTYASVTLRTKQGTVLTGTTYFQPVWGLIKNYRFSTDWNLKLAITKKISMQIDITYLLDRNLPETAAAESYFWVTGLALAL